MTDLLERQSEDSALPASSGRMGRAIGGAILGLQLIWFGLMLYQGFWLEPSLLLAIGLAVGLPFLFRPPPDDRSRRGGDGQAWKGVWLLVSIGVGVRLLWCSQIQTVPRSDFLGFWDAALLFSEAPWQAWGDSKAPMASVYYGVMHSLVGLLGAPGLWGVFAGNALLAGAQVWIVVRMAFTLGLSRRSQWLSGLALALMPSSIYWSSVSGSEYPYTTALLAAELLVARALVRSKDSGGPANPVAWANAGLAFAVANASRPTSLVVFACAGAVLMLFGMAPWQRRVGALSLAVLVFLIASTPVLLYNWQQRQTLSLSPSTFGPIVLYFGTCFECEGRYSREAADRIREQLRDKESHLELMNRSGSLARETLMEQPAAVVAMGLTTKIRHMWGRDGNAANWALYGVDAPKELRRSLARIGDRAWWTAIWLAALGLWLLRAPGGPPLVLKVWLVCPLLVTCLLHVIVEVRPRYHFSVVPQILLLAAVGADAWWHRVTKGVVPAVRSSEPYSWLRRGLSR